MKILLRIFTVFFILLASASPIYAKQNTFNKHFKYLRSQKIIDAKLKARELNSSVTQALLLRAGIKALSNELIFVDPKSESQLADVVATTSSRFMKPYVATAMSKKLLPDITRFSAGKKVTRGEAVAFVMRLLEINIAQEQTKLPYKDVKIDVFPGDYINAAYQQNIFRPRPINGKFVPSKLITKREFLEMMYRAIVQKQKIHVMTASRGRVLVAQETPLTTDPKLPPPYDLSDTIGPLAETEENGRPDLVIESATRYSDETVYGDSVLVSVKNIGTAATTVNFGVYDRPDWYNYKPGWNSSIHMAAFTSTSTEDEFRLLPDRSFLFTLYGRCAPQGEVPTNSLRIAVDPDYLPEPSLAPEGMVLTQVNEVDEVSEANNAVEFECGQNN